MSLPEKTELTSMYDVPFIPPSKIKSYMDSNRILKTFNDKIIPEIKKTGVQVYVVPLPLGLQGIYWVDYPMDYVEEKFSAGFKFNNPNETSACGCGESVEITPISELEIK